MFDHDGIQDCGTTHPFDDNNVPRIVSSKCSLYAAACPLLPFRSNTIFLHSKGTNKQAGAKVTSTPPIRTMDEK